MLDWAGRGQPQEMQTLTQAIRLVEADEAAIIVGKDRLQAMNKKIGERIALYPINYKDLQLDECEIVGTFPDGRYNQTALMSRERLNDALDLYKRKTGKPHFMANKTLNVVWLRVPDTETFSRMADQIMTSSLYTNPPVKCETASSGVASFLDGYRTLIWGMRGAGPGPAGVDGPGHRRGHQHQRPRTPDRDGRAQGPGFRPEPDHAPGPGRGGAGRRRQRSAQFGSAYLVVNHGFDGVKFPIAFFPVFLVPVNALWWGPVIGSLTALAGSFFPAWSRAPSRSRKCLPKQRKGGTKDEGRVRRGQTPIDGGNLRLAGFVSWQAGEFMGMMGFFPQKTRLANFAGEGWPCSSSLPRRGYTPQPRVALSDPPLGRVVTPLHVFTSTPKGLWTTPSG